MSNETKHKMMHLLRHACCHVCSARRSGKCVDRGTAVVYSYTRLKHTGCHRPIYSHSIPYLHREKIYDLEQELPSLLQSYELRGKQPLVSDFSRLLRHAIKKGRAPILYGPTKIHHGEFIRHGYAMGVFARHSCIIAMKLHIT